MRSFSSRHLSASITCNGYILKSFFEHFLSRGHIILPLAIDCRLKAGIKVTVLNLAFRSDLLNVAEKKNPEMILSWLVLYV